MSLSQPWKTKMKIEELPKKLPDHGAFFDFDVPEEIKSSWHFLFLPPSSPSESAGGCD
jgi:hypothetical protein